MSARENVHGTGVLLAGVGVLIRGPSGSGKSLLALLLVDTWETRGLSATLVADDRVDLAVETGQVAMHAPQAIAGLIELRGRGIIARPFVGSAPVQLVVDLVDELVRMPEPREFTTDLLGVALPRCPVPRLGAVGAAHQLLLIHEALQSLGPHASRAGQKST